MTVKILALNRYAEKDGAMEPLQKAELIPGRGIAENRLKNPERQVCILTEAARNWMALQEEKGLCFEKVKENMLLDGPVERGGKLAFGDAVLQVGFAEKFCFAACVHGQNTAICPLREGMFFANVLQGGAVGVGDDGDVVAGCTNAVRKTPAACGRHPLYKRG